MRLTPEEMAEWVATHCRACAARLTYEPGQGSGLCAECDVQHRRAMQETHRSCALCQYNAPAPGSSVCERCAEARSRGMHLG